MFRGTTPTLTFSFNREVDFDEIDKLWLTFKTPSVEKTFTEEDVSFTEGKMSVTMTQEDTLAFCKGKIKVQLRYKTKSGKAYATTDNEIEVKGILKDGVI